MPGTRSSPRSTLVDAAFTTMEELTEFAGSTGREGEYRQLGKGRITSRWRWLQLGQFSLNSHRLDNRVHARVAPPKECVALAMMPPPYHLLVEVAEFGCNQLLVTDAVMDFVTRGEARCDTLILPKHVFEASSQALFPRLSTNGEQARLMPCPHSGWSALQAEIQTVLRDVSITSENISHLMYRFLDLMAGETGKRAGETCLGNRSTGHVARRAQE